jgi:aspartate carbamoyltransferase catalytic subunit
MNNSLYQRSLVSIDDLSDAELEHIFALTKKIKSQGVGKFIDNKIVASCFYEASTRTRLSFEAAAMTMGGNIVGFSDANTTSHKKGESLHDSMRVIESYADVIVLRHPLEGAVRLAAEVCHKPVINAGDGTNQHPTQALLDLFTIKECHPDNTALNIVIMGDLKHGRTVNSLTRACSLFNSRLYFVANKELSLPDHVTEMLKQNAIRFSFHHDLSEIIDRADILYVTRLQRERTDTHYEKAPYMVDLDVLVNAKPGLKILHPLPRVGEISPNVDKTPHAYYFEQAANGLHIRQALLALVLNKEVPL